MHDSLPKFVREPDPSVYLSDSYIVLDVETTNREHGTALDNHNRLILACWTFKGQAHSHWGDEYSQALLLSHIAQVSFVVAHNTKFELGWLKRCGLDLRRILTFDTMIGEKVLAGNRKTALGLDATAQRRGVGAKAHTASALIKASVSPADIPEGILESYCRQDVALTEKIFLAQRKELNDLGLLPVTYCRNLVTPVLADIEFNGMTLDPIRVGETYGEYAARYASLESEFHTITGGINQKSGKQMREYVYGALAFAELTDHRGNAVKTGAGKPKTDKGTLAGLVATTPEQRAFKKVAVELAKLKVPMQNLTKMKAIVEANPDDPRVYAAFNQTVTQTDRLSSTGRNGGFQFHNFDRAFKLLFRAREVGRVVCEADAPQLEFRVAAFLGNDARAIQDISEGVDVHAATAATLGVKRQDAKAFTFKPLYGGNSGTPRQLKYYAYFRDRYNGISRTQSGWTYDVAREKSLRTATGLIFHWPDTEIKRSGYVTNTTQIYNYPIQSLATADVIPLVLVLVWHHLSSFGDRAVLVNSIHDSVIAEVSVGALGEYKQVLVSCFTVEVVELLKRLYGIDFNVPLGVGIKAGEFWSEGKEEKFEPVLP